MLTVYHPSCLAAEVRWLCSLVFEEFGGLAFTCIGDDRECVSIECEGHSGVLQLSVSSILAVAYQWGTGAPNFVEVSLEQYGLRQIPQGVMGGTIPVSDTQRPERLVDRSRGIIHVHADLLGTIFFLQSRYEECFTIERDAHDRFPATACAHREWLHRPVADECKWLLFHLMRELWPSLPEPQGAFRCLPSHDIDFPSIYDGGQLGKRCFALLRSGCALRAAVSVAGAPWGARSTDGYNTISWLLDQSERRGLKSAFYYIPETTDQVRDPQVDLASPRVVGQWREIARRGHEIGLHPGYNTYLDGRAIRSAVDSLRAALVSAGIDTEVGGGRQHYLRWRSPDTARHWAAAGLRYDSTLGFAERAGFRCGTCREFELYDVLERRPMGLRERPLVLMDVTLMNPAYEDLGRGGKALERALQLKDACRAVGGDFTILWHNTRVFKWRERKLYQTILDA